MNYSDMGTVYQFLLQHRVVESKPSSGRKMITGECEVANILKSCDFDDLDRFDEFLSTQGFAIHMSTDQDYQGIPVGGRVWMLKRVANSESPSFLSKDPIYSGLRLKESESKESLSVWFLHIWLIYLSIIYTRQGRTPEQVSKYIDSFFDEEELIEAVKEHIESIRNIGAEDKIQNRAIEILDSEKGNDIPRRVKGFLSIMSHSRLVIKLQNKDYKQTLLGAIEVSDSYRNTMLGTLIPDEGVLSNLVQILSSDPIEQEQ